MRTEHPTGAQTARNAAARVAGKPLPRIIPNDHVSNKKQTTSQKVKHQTTDTQDGEDPRSGLPDEAVVKNGHFMLLLKPQIALRSENGVGNDLIAVGEKRPRTSGTVIPHVIVSKHCLPP